MHVIEITENKGAICAGILATLPHWFGIPESNAAYARDVEPLAMYGVAEEESVIGFLALKPHTPYATEIVVMGVRPEFHRSGAGAALVRHAEEVLRREGIPFLTVKTRSDSRPDWGYLRTLAFYRAMGFVPIKEFPTLWDAENPALMLIKAL
jgi:ribosomal protein S18 acetylase RimI-like enzyme